MSRNGRFPILILIMTIFVGYCQVLAGQDAVPIEIMQRTILIRGPQEQGTAFKIDHKGKLYLVTARHVVAGLPVDNPTIQVRQADTWRDLKLRKLIYPASDDVDIAIFVSGEDVAQPYGITTEGVAHGVTMGQQVWFLGYPFLEGLGTKAPNFEAPFIKHGTMSAIVSTDPNAVVFYIDGFNNKGFSGGPIVFWDFSERRYKILGVVKGYKNDSAMALVNGQQVDTNILVNSGILVAYSIDHAIQAIDKELELTK